MIRSPRIIVCGTWELPQCQKIDWHTLIQKHRRSTTEAEYPQAPYASPTSSYDHINTVSGGVYNPGGLLNVLALFPVATLVLAAKAPRSGNSVTTDSDVVVRAGGDRLVRHISNPGRDDEATSVAGLIEDDVLNGNDGYHDLVKPNNSNLESRIVSPGKEVSSRSDARRAR
jgi:hypothetical protein